MSLRLADYLKKMAACSSQQGDGAIDERGAIRATIGTAETERIKRNAAAERLTRFLLADHADEFIDLPKDVFDAALEAEMQEPGPSATPWRSARGGGRHRQITNP